MNLPENVLKRECAWTYLFDLTIFFWWMIYQFLQLLWKKALRMCQLMYSIVVPILFATHYGICRRLLIILCSCKIIFFWPPLTLRRSCTRWDFGLLIIFRITWFHCFQGFVFHRNILTWDSLLVYHQPGLKNSVPLTSWQDLLTVETESNPTGPLRLEPAKIDGRQLVVYRDI